MAEVTCAVGTTCCTSWMRGTKIFDMWLDAVQRLDPAPCEVVVASDHDFPEDPRYTLVRFKPWLPYYVPEHSYGRKLLKIGEGREAVRRHFLEKGYEWLLFLDSDVIAPPETFKVMHGLAERHKVQIVQNLAEQRTGGIGAVWFGCVLIHRDVLRNVVFYSIAASGDSWLSEDWIFFNILKWHNWWTPGRYPWIRAPVVPVKHYVSETEHRPVLPCHPEMVRPQTS